MSTEKPSFALAPRHQGYIALLLWGVVALLLVRRDIYGLDEYAARSLLLSWSIADQVANSAITFGMPDLRILLFLPIGFLWPGKVFAAKVLTAALLAIATWLLFAWRSRSSGAEGALLSSGLLLISPLALAQIDSISSGVYLLVAFIVGAWLDARYRANPRPFNGWFFALLFTCGFSTSLHPAGLAFPLALMWSWRTLPQSGKYQKYFLAGILFSAGLLLLLRMGWGDLSWLRNPVFALSSVFTGTAVTTDISGFMQWAPGIVVLVLAAYIAVRKARDIWRDLAGRSMLLAVLIGAFVGDQGWAFLTLAFVLYFGFPLPVPRNSETGEGGLVAQRGLMFGVLFVCTTFFMLADKAYYTDGQQGRLSAQDALIKTLAVAAEDQRQAAETSGDDSAKGRFIVASEWPGRTMIACKCDTFPLPPVIPNKPQEQLAKLHSIDYLLFDPKETTNIELARNFSLLGGAVETVSLQAGGVILHVSEAASPATATVPPAREGRQAK